MPVEATAQNREKLEMRCARRRVRFVTKRRKKCAETQPRNKGVRACVSACVCLHARELHFRCTAALKPRRASSLRRMYIRTYVYEPTLKSQVSRINQPPHESRRHGRRFFQAATIIGADRRELTAETDTYSVAFSLLV